MNTVGIITVSMLSVFAFVLFIIYIKSRRPLRAAALNALIGILSLAAVNLTARFTGVYIPVNIYSLPATAVFGLPAAAVLIVLQIVFI